MVGICTCKMVCGLDKVELLISKLFSHFHDLMGMADSLGMGSSVADNFHMQGVIAFLPHGPVNAI